MIRICCFRSGRGCNRRLPRYPGWSIHRTAWTTRSVVRQPIFRSILLWQDGWVLRRRRGAKMRRRCGVGCPPNDPLIANGRPYTIRVRLPDANRASLEAIQNTVFNSSTGRTATLGAMATMTQLPPQNEIRRENLQQVIQVSGRLEGSDLGGTMQKVQAAVSRLQIPSSVRVEYGGTYQEQQRSFADLARVLVLALALVFGVLLTEFRNFAAPISILTSSVLSLAGVVFG